MRDSELNKKACPSLTSSSSSSIQIIEAFNKIQNSETPSNSFKFPSSTVLTMYYQSGDNARHPDWDIRKHGAMKKVHQLYALFGAKAALLLEKDGVLYVYKSHDDFPEKLPGPMPTIMKKPGNFIFLAESESAGGDTESQLPPSALLSKPAFRIEKSWEGRKHGAMKKVHQLWALFGAKAALLLERDGIMFVYRSQEDFPVELPGSVAATNMKKPANFITVAEATSGQRNTMSLSPPPPTLPAAQVESGPNPYMSPCLLDVGEGTSTQRRAPQRQAHRVAKKQSKKVQQGRAYFTRLRLATERE